LSSYSMLDRKALATAPAILRGRMWCFFTGTCRQHSTAQHSKRHIKLQHRQQTGVSCMSWHGGNGEPAANGEAV
jgi:hypothetical protein